jgi:hypothetical protein
LLLRKAPGEAPYYVRLPWTEATEQEMDSAMMLAKERQTSLLVDADKLSSWAVSEGNSFKTKGKAGRNGDQKGQAEKEADGKGSAQNPQGKEGGESMFYPKPVQPDPLKTPAHTNIEVH